MRIILYITLVLLSLRLQAQLRPGFDKQEARDMIALCNSFTFIDLFRSDDAIIPAGYERVYTSPTLAMDNIYQIYRKGDLAVINVRGSTDQKLSWLENFYSSMIPARGNMFYMDRHHEYSFARDPLAAVHCGYALAVVIMADDILPQIDKLNKEGITDFIITGHSQGGALTHMFRAYLEHTASKKLSRRNHYKVYAFACPMIGNKEMIDEYSADFCSEGMSYTLINPQDLVPTFPVTYRDGSFVTANDLKQLLFSPDSFSFSKFAVNIAINLLDRKIARSVNHFGESVSREIARDIGPLKMPAPLEKINFVRVCNIIDIPVAEYPKILKDSSILRNDSLMAIYHRDANGHFYNQNLYKKEAAFYQHKPYNYYTSVLKKYFPDDYQALKIKNAFVLQGKK